MNIDFYYWGTQCPINYEIKETLATYTDYYNLEFHDVSENYSLAKEQRMFFPFLTVVNGVKRYRAPLTKEHVERIMAGDLYDEQPFIIHCGSEVYSGDIQALTSENINCIVRGCTVTDSNKACHSKKEFLNRYLNDVYGFVNMRDNQILGGVEYMPSMKVPYDIPKAEDTAFLTCVYHSSTQYDYKTKPLLELENYLKDKFKRVLAITDEESCFPNGTLKWFIQNGYKDMGVISREINYCNLHLVCKEL